MSSADGNGASAYPLAGNVSKALLIITPAFAREREFVQYLKYKLYDAGFIVVREELRLLNEEMAEKLTVELDQSLIPPVAASPAQVLADDSRTQAALPMFPPATTEDLVGTAYLFVVARTNCHELIHSFMAKQLCTDDADVLNAFLEQHHVQGRRLPLWTSQTPSGARKSVALLFPRMLAEDVPTSAVSQEYVQAHLKQALVPALSGLAKLKPDNPVHWLAMQLLATNTQAPPMMTSPS